MDLCRVHSQPACSPAARLLTSALAAGLTMALAGPVSAMRVATGTYTGTAPQRSVSTAGFQPAVVIVKGNANQPAVIKTATMTGTFSKFFDTSQSGYDDGIRSLDAGGFTVGAASAVNKPLTSYTLAAGAVVSFAGVLYPAALTFEPGLAYGPPPGFPWMALPDPGTPLVMEGRVATVGAPFNDLLPAGNWEITWVFEGLRARRRVTGTTSRAPGDCSGHTRVER